jgi:hypothetical protein
MNCNCAETNNNCQGGWNILDMAEAKQVEALWIANPLKKFAWLRVNPQ